MAIATETVNTKKTEGRRNVRYNSLTEFMEDAARLATIDVRTVGNWSQGQIYEHLARALNLSIDGDKLFPAPMRLVLNLFFKSKFLNNAIPPGFKAPSNFVPDETTVEVGLESLRNAMTRQGETTDRAAHPGFGKLSRDEWDLFHLRHAEMHMSFIVEQEHSS